MRVAIPSVGYADFLADTLPAWIDALPTGLDVTVVTSHEDLATVDVVRANPGAHLLQTAAWTEAGATFNKARALDAALGTPAVGEVCLSLDADVYPAGKLPAFQVASGTLYGCPRLECRTRTELLRSLSGAGVAFRLIPPRQRGGGFAVGITRESAGIACLGYFQLFRYAPGLRFGDSRTAGGYDVRFRARFARRECVPGFSVLHLGELDRLNWRGRRVPEWR